METLVLKFGGAALRDLAQFQKVADIIVAKKNKFDRLVVVVSAMAKMTDELIALSMQISKEPPKREQDMLISVGERISMTLLAMVLFERGCKAISLTGSQAGIITCSNHTDAKVLSVKPNRIIPFLDLGNIVIVAGFQGVSSLGEVTTLGRGGSDTTAVALAIALNALRVEFYKDVKGVFTGDPKKDDSVRHLPTLSYDEALNIVENSERKVLHPRALELASRNNIPLFVSSFEEEGLGTSIQDEGAKRNLDPIYEVIECPV